MSPPHPQVCLVLCLNVCLIATCMFNFSCSFRRRDPEDVGMFEDNQWQIQHRGVRGDPPSPLFTTTHVCKAYGG